MVRLGAGKRLRHLEATQFFWQGLVKQGVITIRKVKGTEHVADLGTKYLTWPKMVQLLKKLDVKLLSFAGASLLPGGEAASVKKEEARKIGKAKLLRLCKEIDKDKNGD